MACQWIVSCQGLAFLLRVLLKWAIVELFHPFPAEVDVNLSFFGDAECASDDSPKKRHTRLCVPFTPPILLKDFRLNHTSVCSSTVVQVPTNQ
jgi:hypothetical protein